MSFIFELQFLLTKLLWQVLYVGAKVSPAQGRRISYSLGTGVGMSKCWEEGGGAGMVGLTSS